jgi:hypothetical protein
VTDKNSFINNASLLSTMQASYRQRKLLINNASFLSTMQAPIPNYRARISATDRVFLLLRGLKNRTKNFLRCQNVTNWHNFFLTEVSVSLIRLLKQLKGHNTETYYKLKEHHTETYYKLKAHNTETYYKLKAHNTETYY